MLYSMALGKVVCRGNAYYTSTPKNTCQSMVYLDQYNYGILCKK